MIPAVIALVVIGVAAFLWRRGGGPAAAPLANAQRTQVTFTGTAEFTTALSPNGQQIAFADRICDDSYNCTYDLVVQL